MTLPYSKSHLHRLLVARFLSDPAGFSFEAKPVYGDDIAATVRCLEAMKADTATPTLDCGESGSTLRFLAPVAAALGKRPLFRKRGRLAARPSIDYSDGLRPGTFELDGGVSSQFVTGLLFALPILGGDSDIVLTSPLESRGYVDMTIDVLRSADIQVEEDGNRFHVRGNQHYGSVDLSRAEADWSGAAFWLAMNALGSDVSFGGEPKLSPDSRQPDLNVAPILALDIRSRDAVIDVSSCPDIFPVLAIVAGQCDHYVRFVGIRRLRLKESDRVAAMADVLCGLGVGVEVGDNEFVVHGSPRPYKGGRFTSFGDHRVAMSLAVAATCAEGQIEIDNTSCAAKSYPDFFRQFCGCQRR